MVDYDFISLLICKSNFQLLLVGFLLNSPLLRVIRTEAALEQGLPNVVPEHADKGLDIF